MTGNIIQLINLYKEMLSMLPTQSIQICFFTVAIIIAPVYVMSNNIVMKVTIIAYMYVVDNNITGRSWRQTTS